MARTRQDNRRGPRQPLIHETTTPLPEPSTASRVPSVLRFPLVAIISLATSLALRSVSSPFSEGDLSGVSTQRDDWIEIAGFLGWKILDLAVAWFSDYDAWDTGALTFLAHLPYYYLLTLCYNIRPTTVLNSIAIDVLAAALPFYLLRQMSAPNNSQAPKEAVANRPVIKDRSVRSSTSLAAAGVYSVVLYSSLKTWLPVFLITRFEGLRDLEGIHNAQFGTVIIGCIMNGIAAQIFIFTPSMGSKPDTRDARNAAFNPATATFGETVAWNLWGHSKRTRTLIKRTWAVILASFGHTVLQTWLVVEGAEVTGAAGWAAIWAVAAVLTGTVFWWVGDVEGITN